MIVVYIVAGVLFGAGALAAVVRLVRGPSILDRMIASDMLLTILLLSVGAEMVINGHLRTVPLMLVLGAAASLATIAVARYVSQHGDRKEQR